MSPGKTARVLLLGDAHGDFRFIDRALRVAQREACDALVQLGDFGFWPDGPRRKRGEIVLYQRWLETVAASGERHGVPVRVLFGNHDFHPAARAAFTEHPGTRLRVVRDRWLDLADNGSTWTWCGIRFGALGGAFSIDGASRTPGVDYWPETELTSDNDVERLASQGNLDVLLTHDAPSGVPVPGLRKLRPILEKLSDDNRRQISRAVEAARPRVLAHGHLHSGHEASIEHADGTSTRVHGLASNLEGSIRSRGILELPSLDFVQI